MPGPTLTPNMGLPVPVPSNTDGPEWAQDVVSCFSAIDSHNHTSGQGVQITPAGINVNTDFPFNQNNLTLLRSVAFYVQNSPISLPTDLSCLYASGTGGDLYFNDGAGNQIRITQSGSVAGSSGTITGLPSGTASASYASVSGTFVFQQATSTAANMDIGTLIIRYPGSYPTPSGNYIALEAPSSLASGYSIKLPASVPASNGFFWVQNSDGSMTNNITVDTTTIGFLSGPVLGVIDGGISTAKIANLSVTAAKIANATITTAQISASAAIIGTQLSASANILDTQRAALAINSSFNLSLGISPGTGFQNVTNVTLTTTGRPVLVIFEPIASASGSSFVEYIDGGSGPSNVTANQELVVDGTVVKTWTAAIEGQALGGAIAVPFFGPVTVTGLSASAHTFLIRANLVGGGSGTGLNYSDVQLTAIGL